jgi:hypothetical protein
MDKYLTVDEFTEVVTTALKATLKRDFGDGKSHLVDLMTHATTGMEWMYQFVDAMGGVEYERQLKTKVEDIEPIVKSGKKSK